MSIKSVTLIRSVVFIALVIMVGWNTSVWAKAHDPSGIPDGLVRALDSVGRNLYDSTAFGVSEVSIIELDGMPPAVQFDIRGYKTIPDEPAPPFTLINVVDPDNPCQIVAQVLLRGDMDPEITEGNFYGSLPKTCEEPVGDR